MEYVLRYDAQPNKSTEFRQWLRDNESAIREHQPDGWTYKGTYFTVRGFGAYSNETRWELEDYAALGTGFGDDHMVRLTQEWFDFIDQHRPFQASLYKDATEVDILPGS